jgi:hypothetical protein
MRCIDCRLCHGPAVFALDQGDDRHPMLGASTAASAFAACGDPPGPCCHVCNQEGPRLPAGGAATDGWLERAAGTGGVDALCVAGVAHIFLFVAGAMKTFPSAESSLRQNRTEAAHERRLRVERAYSTTPSRMALIGATSSLPRTPAKVPSPSDLPTFVIVHCKTGVC